MPTTDSPQSRESLLAQQKVAPANSGIDLFTIRLLVAVRLIYLCELLVFVQVRDWASLLFYGAIFIGSLVVPLLGRFDPEYYRLDIFVVFVFAMGPVFTSFSLWPEPDSIQTLLFGKDKPLHIAGGACLAMFAAIGLRTQIPSARMFYMLIVICALALGGAWEIFEWVTSVLPRPFRLESSGYADSMLDMVADTMGAMIAAAALKARGYHQRFWS